MLNTGESGQIGSKLKNIFSRMFGIDIDMDDEKMPDENLLGKKLNMTPADLVYLFFEIEREFGITIPQEDIAEGKFNSFNNIIGIIGRQLQHSLP